MEEAIIRGIAHDSSEAKLTVQGVPDQPGIASSLFTPMAEDGINVDMIVQNVSSGGITDISFTVPKEHVVPARKVAERIADDIGAAGVDADENIAKVSLVGAGMKSETGVAARMFDTLASNGINIEMISTSQIRISCVVRGDEVDDAVRVLHAEFQPPTMPSAEVTT